MFIDVYEMEKIPVKTYLYSGFCRYRCGGVSGITPPARGEFRLMSSGRKIYEKEKVKE